MGNDMCEEGRNKGELIAEMSCALQIVKRLKEMGFTVKQVLKTIELPENAVMRVFDGKEDIRKIAQDTVNQQIAENGGKIPQERDFIKWVENALEYFTQPQDKEELIPFKEPQRLTCEQWAQYTPYENKACINRLYALEGAIRNIRCHYLSQDIKDELKAFYLSLNVKQ